MSLRTNRVLAIPVKSVRPMHRKEYRLITDDDKANQLTN